MTDSTEAIPGWAGSNEANLPVVLSRAWDGNAQIYEWDQDFGDVGPQVASLELELFGEPSTRERTGLDFSK